VKVCTTAIAVWQDWVSAVKVGKSTNGNVKAYEPGESANYGGLVATLLKSEIIVACLFCTCSKIFWHNSLKARGFCLKQAYNLMPTKYFLPQQARLFRNTWCADTLTRTACAETLTPDLAVSLPA
jgi:hypothetical protein